MLHVRSEAAATASSSSSSSLARGFRRAAQILPGVAVGLTAVFPVTDSHPTVACSRRTPTGSSIDPSPRRITPHPLPPRRREKPWFSRLRSGRRVLQDSTTRSHHDPPRGTLMAEDCLVCGEALSASDTEIPLPCPSTQSSCPSVLCADCLHRMRVSAQDDYQEASDGSRQVKTRLQCPMCRSKYQVILGDDPSTRPPSPQAVTRLSGHELLLSVVVLRQAHAMLQNMVRQGGDETAARDDSGYSSTELTRKDLFCKQYSWEHLQECHQNYAVYMASLPGDPPKVVPLSLLEPLKPWLQGGREATVHDMALSPRNDETGSTDQPLTDPTLFLGLDELLTPTEQDFCSQLLVSNDLHKIHQACLILQGMLQLPTLARSTPHSLPRHEQRHYQHLDRVRKRYPLPPHMPRCVRLSSAGECLHKPKYFATDPTTGKPSLTLKTIRGVAGQVGLRKGDVITHVEGEVVDDLEHFQKVLADTIAASHDGSVLIAVNICPDVARLLQERNDLMKKERVRFEYTTSR